MALEFLPCETRVSYLGNWSAKGGGTESDLPRGEVVMRGVPSDPPVVRGVHAPPTGGLGSVRPRCGRSSLSLRAKRHCHLL